MPASPMRYEAFLRSLSRPNHATGWFHPATPLPDAEVSFLTGEVIRQAGMAEMGGFEPPFAVCAPVSLTHGCSCRELQNAITTLPHLHEGGCSSFRAASQSCDGAQALLRQQSFKRSRTHLLEGELNDLAFGHVSMCPQLQHRGLRGLLQDFASPIRLFR